MATPFLNLLAGFNPAITGGGLLLGTLANIGDIVLGNKRRKRQREAAFMSAMSYMDAANMQEHMGIWAKDIADNNAAAQLTYAKNLLEVGETNMQYVSLQVAKAKTQIAKEGSRLMSEASLRSIASGVELSGSAITRLTDIQDQVMDQISDVQFQGDLQNTSILLQSQQASSQAQMQAINMQTQGLVEQAQYKYNAMSQKVNSFGIIEAAKIGAKTEAAQLWGKGLHAGTSLLGKAAKYSATYG